MTRIAIISQTSKGPKVKSYLNYWEKGANVKKIGTCANNFVDISAI